MPKYDKDSIRNTFFIAIAVSLVCSVIVSVAAVTLKPMQIQNKLMDQKENIVRAAGLLKDGQKRDDQDRGVHELFELFTVRAVDLEKGQFTDDIDPANYDQLKAAKMGGISRHLSKAEDDATIGRLEKYGLVYLIEKDGKIETVVIPVRGYGLWGTLYGYLALKGDFRTVEGLGFYENKETPGLGGEVTNPKWKAQWPGLQIYDENGQPAVKLVKTRSAADSVAATHEVDALSGASMTSRGVKNLINFWTGDMGYGRFLRNMAEQSADKQNGRV